MGEWIAMLAQGFKRKFRRKYQCLGFRQFEEELVPNPAVGELGWQCTSQNVKEQESYGAWLALFCFIEQNVLLAPPRGGVLLALFLFLFFTSKQFSAIMTTKRLWLVYVAECHPLLLCHSHHFRQIKCPLQQQTVMTTMCQGAAGSCQSEWCGLWCNEATKDVCVCVCVCVPRTECALTAL